MGKLQALPKDANPVTKWSDQDEAFFNITQGIKLAVKDLRERTLSTMKTVSTVAKLRIHGWKYQPYDDSPDVELNWTAYFDIDKKPLRKIARFQTWRDILLPQLKQTREQLTGKRANLTIDVQGLLPLSAALTIGNIFQDTAGYILQNTQRTVGQNQIWRSSANPSTLKFKVVKEQEQKTAKTILKWAAVSTAISIFPC